MDSMAILRFASGALLLAAAQAAAQQDPSMVVVNGVAIKQSQVLQRLWGQYGPATLQDMVDEILLKQSAGKLKVKPNPKDVEARLSRIRQQFRDQATFEAQLRQAGTTVEEVKRQISDQIVKEALVAKVKGIKVSDSEVKDAYEQNKLKLGSAETIRLRHILVKTEQEARDLLIAVRAGADFGKLAREKSLDAASRDKGGDFGFISSGMLQPEIEKMAFGMKPGEANFVSMQDGYHILQVAEHRPAQAADFGKVKGDLRQILLSNKITQALPAYLVELRAGAKIEPQFAAGPGPAVR